MIKVECKELQLFDSNPFASTYVENCNNNDNIFDDYFAMDDINKYVGSTNEIKLYLTLIDVFKQMTNYLENHCIAYNINEIRAYLNNKIV